MADTLAAVSAAKTRTDSLIAYRAVLKAEVQAMLTAEGAHTNKVQAGLDKIFDIENADAAEVDAALNANVPKYK